MAAEKEKTVKRSVRRVRQIRPCFRFPSHIRRPAPRPAAHGRPGAFFPFSSPSRTATRFSPRSAKGSAQANAPSPFRKIRSAPKFRRAPVTAPHGGNPFPGITILFSLPRTPRGEIPPGSSLPPIPAAPEHRRPAPERFFRPCPPPPQGSRPPGFRMAGFSGTPAAAYEKRPERPGLFPSLQRRRIRRFSAPRPSPHRHLHPSFSHPLRPRPRCRVSGRARPCGGAFPQPRR